MNPKQKKLLASVLQEIPHEGWTAQAFARGVKASGVAAQEARKQFPRGVEDVVAAFHDSIDEAMREAIAGNRKFAALRVRDKVAFAVRARLQAIEPHREAMRRLLAWSVMPRHIRSSARYLWRAADAAWIAAGDASTDYNRYTKRLLLIAVMKSALSFWLNDESDDRAETWKFLDRRIGDVMKVGKGISVIKTVGISDIADFVRKRFAA